MFKAEQTLQQRYQLQKQLGRTAAGHQTWLALDNQSNEEVTVKLLAFSPQMQWEELKLFEREAQVLQSLNHPRIPRYRDYFDIDKHAGEGVPWFALVQDYIPGFSLQESLEQGKRFSEKQVRAIATEILEILVYLHQLSPPVLHRDIKPSNLIFGKDEHVYLVDFGAVQAQAAVTGVTFTIVGTSGYAPLEQFWGRAVPTSDLYALGATLIHLLTGTSPADLPQKDSRIQFRDRVTLQEDLIAWIEKVTEISIEKRFSNATEALKSLTTGQFLPSSSPKLPVRNKIPRPHYSSIHLNKSKEKLEIYIPAGGIGRLGEAIGNIGCAGAMIIAIVFGIVMYTFARSPLLGIPLILPLGFLIGVAVTFFGENTQIYCDRQKIVFERNALGINYGKRALSNHDILGVFLHNKGGTNQVSIRSWSGIDFLGGGLTENEAIWLAQEIQDWLNM